MNAKKAFSGYLCWDPKEVDRTVFVDAVSPSDAVFLATHQPMRIIKSSFTGAGEPEFVDEDRLLRDFLRPEEKMMLLPIRGESGAGKSHLVRWIGAKIGNGGDGRRVIYVPKYGTSLRKVIELILDKMEGEEVEDLRASLHEATSKLDEVAAPSSVLSALADRIEFAAPLREDAEDYEVKEELRQTLPSLIRDPYYRKWFLRDGGLVQHFVKAALSGQRQGDQDKPFEFNAEELPLTLDGKDASKEARDVNQRLRYQTAAGVAIEMMTVQLGPAIQTVFGLEGASSLTDVMLKTRRTLASQGEELVLLIEDFTILQGIQRELLDAIVEPPERAGEQDLCGIRTTLAVTSGYFDSLADTIKTRAAFASHIYDLNVPFSSSDPQGEARVIEFVGRYLNATRVGSKALEKAWTPGNTEQPDWAPNKCIDCAFREPCHEGFGASEEGYGLYPFNDVAVRRLVQAVTPSRFFDPRAVLGQVVRRTLEVEASDLKAGRFPSAEYGQSFTAGRQKALPANVAMALTQYPAASQRQVLLTIWGDSPDTLVNLPDPVHEAFRIPLIDEVPTEVPTWHAIEETTVPSTHKADPATERLERTVSLIDTWSTGTGLIDADLARDLRQQLVDLVRARIDWDISLLKSNADFVTQSLEQGSFEIENAAGGRTIGPKVWRTKLEPSIENGSILRAIVQYRFHSDWSFSGGPEAYRLLCDRLDLWAAEVVGQCRANSEVHGKASIESAAQGLVVGAALLGIPEAGTGDPLDLLHAVFVLTTSDHIRSHTGREGPLGFGAKNALDPRRLGIIERLRLSYGARQGSGALTHAIDPVPLLKAIDGLLASGTGSTVNESASKYVQEYASPVLRPWRHAIEIEAARVTSIKEQIDQALGGNYDLKLLADLLLTAASAAGDVQTFYPGHELHGFKSQCERLPELVLPSVLNDVQRGLDELPETSDLAALVWFASHPFEQISPLREFLTRATDYMENALRRGQQTVSAQSGGVNAAEELRRSLSSLEDMLARVGGSR